MNERALTLAGALIALVIAAGLFFNPGAQQMAPVSRPLSHDTGSQGLAGAARWLRQSGASVVALRDRYFELNHAGAAQAGNLLIITEPSVYPPRPSELQSLRDWIKTGNDLLLLESIAQRPAWTLATKRALMESSLLSTLGLSHTAPLKDKEQDAVCGGTSMSTNPERAGSTPVLLKPHPSDVNALLLQGVREVRIKPEADAIHLGRTGGLTYSNNKDHEIFDWLCDVPHGRNALWQFRLGEGRIWVSSYPQLFANRNLALADNARLLANLVAMSVTGDSRHGGAVIFDDMHQGDSTLYDPVAFFSDPRLHASLWLLFTLWLLYLLGYSNRFAPPAPVRPGITPVRFVENLGGYFARQLDGASSADLLLRNLRRELARRHASRSPAAPLQDMLRDLPRLDAQLPEQLLDAEAQLRGSKEKDLRPLARVIHQIREQLQ